MSDGQCRELPDKFAAPLIPAICTPITAAEYDRYIETMRLIDLEVERRVHAMPAKTTPAKTVRRTYTESEWEKELGQNMPGYWKRADRHFRQQLETRK